MADARAESRGGFSPKRFFSSVGAVLAAALISVVIFKTTYFFFFFPLPLAFAAFFKDAKTAWAAGILAAAVGVLVLAWFYLYEGAGYEETPFLLLRFNTLYYSVMVLSFTWVNAPLGKFWPAREVPYRMAAAAFVSALILAPFLVSMIQNPGFRALVISRMDALGSITSSSGLSAFTIDDLLSSIVYIGVRGGVILSCLFFWWLNRQFALIIVRFIRRGKPSGSDAAGTSADAAGAVSVNAALNFKTPFFLVWIFSCSLAAILLGNIAGIELLEIAGWNILAVSGILFLVQGGAVALYFLAKVPPLPRIFVNIGIVFLVLRPGINAVILVVLVILGIAENWVPFRAPKQ